MNDWKPSKYALALLLFCCVYASARAESGRPLLVTVDDLPISGASGSDPDERRRITEGLLDVLERHGVRAVGFVTWNNVSHEGDLALLDRWLEAGHELGNHSNRHLNYTSTDVETYLADVESARKELHRFLDARGKELRFFRFPYLREGSTPEKLGAMRHWLDDTGQRNLPVTLDNQDWSFARSWLAAHRSGDKAEKARVSEAFHESIHLSIRYHESVGDRLFDREVPQVLLLHALAMGVEEWDRLFSWFVDRGYRFAEADEILADPAFSEPHAYVGPRGRRDPPRRTDAAGKGQRRLAGAGGKVEHRMPGSGLGGVGERFVEPLGHARDLVRLTVPGGRTRAPVAGDGFLVERLGHDSLIPKRRVNAATAESARAKSSCRNGGR